MSGNDILLVLFSILALIVVLYIWYSFPSAFLKEFEKSCYKAIKKRDKELEEKEKLNRELRKWLFK